MLRANHVKDTWSPSRLAQDEGRAFLAGVRRAMQSSIKQPQSVSVFLVWYNSMGCPSAIAGPEDDIVGNLQPEAGAQLHLGISMHVVLCVCWPQKLQDFGKSRAKVLSDDVFSRIDKASRLIHVIIVNHVCMPKPCNQGGQWPTQRVRRHRQDRITRADFEAALRSGTSQPRPGDLKHSRDHRCA